MHAAKKEYCKLLNILISIFSVLNIRAMFLNCMLELVYCKQGYTGVN